MDYNTLLIITSIVFGALWGSFLNVVISRVPSGLSIVSPPSRCPVCETQIKPYDNIPISCKFNNPVNILSLEVTNNESTADVILNGSDFGNPAFTTNDYFKIIIEGFFNNQSTGIIEYLLADYTGGNEIVIDSWEEIDLSTFGTVDSIQFNLESTHTGDYGMNTPAYFVLII